MTGCEGCPGCGQFCDYPYCTGVERPKPLTEQQLADLYSELVGHAATWEARYSAKPSGISKDSSES